MNNWHWYGIGFVSPFAMVIFIATVTEVWIQWKQKADYDRWWKEFERTNPDDVEAGKRWAYYREQEGFNK